MSRRASGILLPVTALPSRYGIGDLGPWAYRFVEFLARAGQRYWQVLPLHPPAQDRGTFCPYDASSAFAGNPLLISPEWLLQEGLVRRTELADVPTAAPGKVQYRLAGRIKSRLLQAAYERFKRTPAPESYLRFCAENRYWLEDFAAFVALGRHLRTRLWSSWPVGLRDRRPEALAEAGRSLAGTIGQVRFEQYLFFRQAVDLKGCCQDHDVAMIGDVPIYVAYQSADVWAHADLFDLTGARRPRLVSGVPPDAFSRTGQLWGNPVYDWTACSREGFEWWVQRVRHSLALFDVVRLDHFRGFVGFWAVPAGHRTAARGRWRKGPGRDLIERLLRQGPARRFIAEDLGQITDDVRALMRDKGLMSMRVLQFAFDGRPAANPHYPHNHDPCCVVYPGTHDNDTAVGWFLTETDARRRKELSGYAGHRVTARTVHEDLIHLALGSPARLAVIPMQDLLGLGSEARMNRPATTRGNWLWQLRPDQMTAPMAQRLASWTAFYGR